MKTARCTYHLANVDRNLYAYFDPKAFDGILPALTEAQQEQFIRQICDSIAIAMPQDITEKHLYIKKVYRAPSASSITVFCTDGFLVDSNLTVPVHEQPFQTERIQIKETEQLASRIKLSNDILQTIQRQLINFEEEQTRLFAASQTSAKKEDKPKIAIKMTLAQEGRDKIADIFADIANLKKEIVEMSKSRGISLNNLIKQADNLRNNMNNLMLKDSADLQEESKTKLQDHSRQAIEEEASELIKINTSLKQKINEITPIPDQFDQETQKAYQEINQCAQQFTRFKQLVVEALYHAAKEYRELINKPFSSASSNEKKILINEFNRKFSSIAYLTESGELNSLQESLDNLSPLSLDNLQALISNEEKDQPGLLQKCNTSWTEESPELQIILKKLGQLNAAYRQFFQEEVKETQFANAAMIQIVRIPFPRGFHFKFTDEAHAYHKSIDDFCKAQNDAIKQSAQNYKRIMQIDNITDKTQRTMKEAERISASIRTSIDRFKTLLHRKEESLPILQQAKQNYGQLQYILTTAVHEKISIDANMDRKLKNVQRKIDALMQTITAKETEAGQIMQSLTELQTQIDTDTNTDLLTEKINRMQTLAASLNNVLVSIHEPAASLSYYQQIFATNDLVSSYNIENIRKQHQEAKSLILNFIKQQNQSYGRVSDERQTRVVDLYSQIDAAVTQVQQESKEVLRAKDALLDELNDRKLSLTAEALDAKREPLKNKIQMIEEAMKKILGNLAQIKGEV